MTSTAKEKEAREAFHNNSLWATHTLICTECDEINIVGYGGVRGRLVDEGYPVSEMCHECKVHTRQYKFDCDRK